MKNKIFFSEKDGKYVLPINRNNFTINDSNSEFTDGIFMNWSYPFDILMTDDIIRNIGNFNDPNIIMLKKFDMGYINIEGEVYSAKLKFITCQQSILKCQIEYGYESLAVFDKKLSELGMEIINPPNIYDYIDSHIGNAYPDSSICFPAVYTQKFKDEERNNGFTFQDIYNELGSNGKIKRNEITNQGFLNRNIIKPFVYLMHVVKFGFASEGLEVTGDILNNGNLLNAAMDHENDFFVKFSQQKGNVEVSQQNNYYSNVMQPTYTAFSSTRIFKAKGLYNISLVTQKDNINYIKIQATWYVNNVLQIASTEYNGTDGPDFIIELIQQLPPILVETDLTLSISGNLKDFPDIAGSGSPQPLQTKSLQGYLNPSVSSSGSKDYYETKASINLNEIVPDMTFRELISRIKKWQNYKLLAKDGKVHFISVGNENSEIINISENDVLNFEIGTNERLSYILSHGAPEEYAYNDEEYDRLGIINSGIDLKNDTAEKIEINGYPLSMEDKGYGLTASEKADPGSALVLIKYEGLQTGKNLCLSLDELKISTVYINHYKMWIRNRIESRPIKWSFYTNNPISSKLMSDKKIAAYKNIHKIKGITKKFIGDDAYYIEIESENRP